MAWRLYVLDGADQRKFFVLPQKGKRRIGREGHADIALHDIYVNRVHCEVECDGDTIQVRAVPEAPNGFLINGTKQTEYQLTTKDVLRIGNSHLRLEPHEPTPEDEEEAIAAVAEPRKLPHLPFEQLDRLRGETISHYKLGEILGRGHYGVVFHATHVNSGAEVALKVLSPEFPQNPSEMKRFAAALKSLLLLKHPNLVTLYNAGKTGPYCWLATEYVQGDSLAQVLREPDAKRRSHWKPALRMGLQLAHALEFLRERRLVHGNIVPANVLLGRDEMGRAKDIKLADLMLSRSLEGSALLESRLEAKLAAEIGYLSPEQAAGLPPDSLTDLYGVGAVMYARLTGQPPHQGRTPAETIDHILHSVPRKPIDIHKNIPEQLSIAVMLLLAKPEDRCQSPQQLLEMLEPLAEGEGIES